MKKAVIFTLVFSLLLAGISSADVPKLINLQGKLADANKNPLTGTYNVFNYLVFTTAAALLSIRKLNKSKIEILLGG